MHFRAMALLSLEITAPVVAEIRDKDNLVVVQKMLEKQHLQKQRAQRLVTIAGEDLVGSALVQAAFQPVSRC